MTASTGGIVLAGLALAVVLVAARRWAVRRKQRARARRRQAFQRARRSGVLHVLHEGPDASGRVSIVRSPGRRRASRSR